MKIDPKIHALCYADFDGARARAKTAEVKGVFGAVPFLLKDSALASKQFPTSIGSNLFRDIPFKYDATLVERFNEAGLLSFARETGGRTRAMIAARGSVGRALGGLLQSYRIARQDEITADIVALGASGLWNRSHRSGGAASSTISAVI
ncbi:amidase, partial [Burkholderia pseudomallei]|nr:amidase [Burkholderia pseudomallei]